MQYNWALSCEPQRRRAPLEAPELSARRYHGSIGTFCGSSAAAPCWAAPGVVGGFQIGSCELVIAEATDLRGPLYGLCAHGTDLHLGSGPRGCCFQTTELVGDSERPRRLDYEHVDEDDYSDQYDAQQQGHEKAAATVVPVLPCLRQREVAFTCKSLSILLERGRGCGLSPFIRPDYVLLALCHVSRPRGVPPNGSNNLRRDKRTEL